MSFAVTILGSSSAKPTPDRHPSAQAVNIHEQYYLVDAGEGVQQQLIRYGINPLKLRAAVVETLCQSRIFHSGGLIGFALFFIRKNNFCVLDLYQSDVLFIDHIHKGVVANLCHLGVPKQRSDKYIKEENDQKDHTVVEDHRSFW